MRLRASPNDERLVLATGRYLGEGFDDSRLVTLFLVMPVSWKGTRNTSVGCIVTMMVSEKLSCMTTWTEKCPCSLVWRRSARRDIRPLGMFGFAVMSEEFPVPPIVGSESQFGGSQVSQPVAAKPETLAYLQCRGVGQELVAYREKMSKSVNESIDQCLAFRGRQTRTASNSSPSKEA